MELKNLGENLGFSYLFAGDFEKNETATLVLKYFSQIKLDDFTTNSTYSEKSPYLQQYTFWSLHRIDLR